MHKLIYIAFHDRTVIGAHSSMDLAKDQLTTYADRNSFSISGSHWDSFNTRLVYPYSDQIVTDPIEQNVFRLVLDDPDLLDQATQY